MAPLSDVSANEICGELAAVVINTMAEGVCLIRATDKVIVYANPRFTMLLGYEVGELDGQPASIVNYEREPGDAARIAEAIFAQLRRSGEATYEVRNVCKDGTPLWCRARTTFFHHPEYGDVWVAVHKNIEAEKQLQRQRLVLQTLAEQLPVGLWITDEHGTITFGNAAGQKIWQGVRYVGPESFGEYRGWRIDTGERIAPEEWAVARALSKRETSVGEVLRIECFDGTHKTILNSAAPLIGEDDEVFGAVAVNQDITSLQDAIQARDEILAVVAHDLRGPVNTIGLRAAALAEDLGELAPTGSMRRKWLDGIQRGVGEISRHIEDLLDVARLEEGQWALELGKLDVASLIAEALERLRSRAEGRRLRAECRAPLPPIVADRRRLLQVLDNLLGNAIKFTSPSDQITLGAARQGDELHLWVSDTGPGLERHHLPRVFDRHWQAKPGDRRGVGLGLAIVRDIVEAHGGRAWATSEPGRGATFHVCLPLELER
ncbi:MAG: PAS domain-containing sensor histidine kinase [Enhygromyxa sp.]